MNKWLVALLGIAAMATSAVSQANVVQDQMKLIASNYRTVLKADSPEEFKQGLEAMKQAATLAEQGTPSKLEGQDKDSASMKDFRHGLTTLIGEIDSAKALADAGQFEQAKQAAEQFKLTRDEFHKKYK
ncbi:cytochrome b562 [Budvicia aquatica]|uniref:cytochrome b562 n=1 Tax=Budvicia aquatica TaxID=82979 RepID=UPI001B41260E|nr:cytochrome b562 [Budvicia aquatica]MBP9641899.1 cytochrome b562 [Budvicia sp.]GKX50150.1 putative soluble cytochrome b562 2 [Budvicia aquatica]